MTHNLLSIVDQKDCFHCFPACLSSFFKDNGFNINQDQIVDSCPAAFAKGSTIQGAFSPQSFPMLTESLPIIVTPINSRRSINHPKQTIFFLVDWEKSTSWHWVRFAGFGLDGKKICLMNPLVPDKAEERDLSEFASWPKLAFLIEYVG